MASSAGHCWKRFGSVSLHLARSVSSLHLARSVSTLQLADLANMVVLMSTKHQNTCTGGCTVESHIGKSLNGPIVYTSSSMLYGTITTEAIASRVTIVKNVVFIFTKPANI